MHMLCMEQQQQVNSRVATVLLLHCSSCFQPLTPSPLPLRPQVTPEDIYRVIPLCLRHRLRKDPLAEIDDGDRVRDVFKAVFGME